MIYGKEIKLRPIEEGDLGLMVQWFNDPELAHLVVGWDFPISLAQQKEWFKDSLSNRRNQRWIIEDIESNPLGLTGLWDIDWHNRQALSGIKLGSVDARGKGYGTDVINTIMTYAFCQVGLNRLWADILEYNIPSYKVYVEHCGWKVEGVLRQAVFKDGTFHNLIRVAILRDEFMLLSGLSDYLPAQEKELIKVKLEYWADFKSM